MLGDLEGCQTHQDARFGSETFAVEILSLFSASLCAPTWSGSAKLANDKRVFGKPAVLWPLLHPLNRSFHPFCQYETKERRSQRRCLVALCLEVKFARACADCTDLACFHRMRVVQQHVRVRHPSSPCRTGQVLLRNWWAILVQRQWMGIGRSCVQLARRCVCRS